MKKGNKKPILLLHETYLSLLQNSVGTKMFQNFYIKEGKGRKDILDSGDLSCAFFVSSVLKIFGWIKETHTTVDGTEKDLLDSGWKKVATKNLKAGSVIIWKAEEFEDGRHRHIGFYLGNSTAVSNSAKKKQVILHDVTYGGKREIEAVYNKVKSE